MGDLASGAYESLVTSKLAAQLSRQKLVPVYGELTDTEAPEVLARHVAQATLRALERTKDKGARAKLVNDVLAVLDERESAIESLLAQLLYLEQASPMSGPTGVRPLTPLAEAALLTNASGDPTLGTELKSELASADRVDLICAFIKWSGLRVLIDSLESLKARNIPFRVITTTYIGATERRALDELVRRFGAQVRISYENQSTRLHAKAWLIERDSSFTTAFVGSSNLSAPALLDGLEWNVRLSAVATPRLLTKFAASFDTYWEDPSFVPYDPDTDAERFDLAIARSGGGVSDGAVNISGLEVTARPYQLPMLEALDAERVIHDRHRNLLVAATGTGKTVVAALDYRNLCEAAGNRMSLLFVAHRKEILEQSLRTYREVLADGSFGELYVGGNVPSEWTHVFASIQSLSNAGLERFPSDRYEVIVVDEFHHAEAATYKKLLSHVTPIELLGLTATPERADGTDVRALFDGRAAYELPLVDALDADLLVPFHYFGISDNTDLSTVEWQRGNYSIEGLSNLYTGHDARVSTIVRELRDKVTSTASMRALGFCVSVQHAEYMAERFNQAGISAAVVTGSTPSADRHEALANLRKRTTNILFAVDVFNEGLDIPEIDTVLFLRPTQSPTIFLQQLGRGLRRASGKSVLTVLDFIGQHRREFRLDLRYKALVGVGNQRLVREIEQGFPFLPSGSQLILDRVARERVLDNVRSHSKSNVSALAQELNAIGDVNLESFLKQSERNLVDLYRGNRSWTEVRQRAGMPVESFGPTDGGLLGRVSKFAHVDDSERAAIYLKLLQQAPPEYSELTTREQAFARMLYFLVWPGRDKSHTSFNDGLRHLSTHRAFCREVSELIAIAVDQTRRTPKSLGEGLQHLVLRSHARYHREEILAALGYANWDRGAQGHVSGVAWCEDTLTDALLINLNKDAGSFSPSTMYRDYAISPNIFHWESQNATRTTSPTGARYIGHQAKGSFVVLFTRNSPQDELGAEPFVCLGQAQYISHAGERPMAITWKLQRSMPGEVFGAASVVAR